MSLNGNYRMSKEDRELVTSLYASDEATQGRPQLPAEEVERARDYLALLLTAGEGGGEHGMLLVAAAGHVAEEGRDDAWRAGRDTGGDRVDARHQLVEPGLLEDAPRGAHLHAGDYRPVLVRHVEDEQPGLPAGPGAGPGRRGTPAAAAHALTPGPRPPITASAAAHRRSSGRAASPAAGRTKG